MRRVVILYFISSLKCKLWGLLRRESRHRLHLTATLTAGRANRFSIIPQRLHPATTPSPHGQGSKAEHDARRRPGGQCSKGAAERNRTVCWERAEGGKGFTFVVFHTFGVIFSRVAETNRTGLLASLNLENRARSAGRLRIPRDAVRVPFA